MKLCSNFRGTRSSMPNLSRHTQPILLLPRRTWLIVIEKHSKGNILHRLYYTYFTYFTYIYTYFFINLCKTLHHCEKTSNFSIASFYRDLYCLKNWKQSFMGLYFKTLCFFLLFTESILLYHFSILDACNFQNKLKNAQLLGNTHSYRKIDF